MTKQRKLIFDIIQQSDEHLTAEQIYSIAKVHMPALAIGTVYRNLKIMSDEGDILHIPVAGAPDRYDRTIVPHDHLICDKCKRVYDLSGGDIKSTLENMAGQKITSYDLIVHFVCNHCN